MKQIFSAILTWRVKGNTRMIKTVLTLSLEKLDLPNQLLYHLHPLERNRVLSYKILMKYPLRSLQLLRRLSSKLKNQSKVE